MAEFTINGSTVDTQLQKLLMADSIQPGSDVSYQVCKTIYSYHPLGAKMAESPIEMAQSQEREISIPNSPEDRIKEAFMQEWEKLGCDKIIANVATLSRVYGIASLAYGAKGVPTNKAIDMAALADLEIYFNVLDPLNTAGSLVLNQDPNAADFQKHGAISVSGQAYHRSRTCVILNENPVYIEYTTSAFGYVGRSVYQRAIYPLKSFIQSMITDDMVTRKAGVLVAKLKPAGSITDRLMQQLAGIKRNLLKEAETNNVLSISTDEEIETLNMVNADGAMTTARTNILQNIATAAKMPAKLVNQETFAEGFGEGSEDAKHVAGYINGVRRWMLPLYAFMDKIVMYRAWNPKFYATIQNEFPEYKDVPYTKAFYDWHNSFKAVWPSLLIEPESELIKVEDVKLKALISAVEVLLPVCDPVNKGTLIQWLSDNFNEQKLLFPNPLVLDIEALMEYEPPVPGAEPGEPAPNDLSKSDSTVRKMVSRK